MPKQTNAQTLVDNAINANDTLTKLVSLHGQEKAAKENKKVLGETQNGLVIDQYAEIIPLVIAQKPNVKTDPDTDIRKGKLSDNGTAIKNALMNDREGPAYSLSVGKKRYENSMKAVVRFEWEKSSNLTPDAIRAAFASEGITSEAKLAAYVKQDKGVCEMTKLAQKLIGKPRADGGFDNSDFDEEQWRLFDDAVRVLKEQRAAAAEASAKAKDKVDEENEIVNDVVDQF